MNVPQDDQWTPSHELLAAFADGELDRQPQRELLRRQMEKWLAAHPEDAAALDAQLEIKQWMALTIPPEPSPVTWARLWSRVHRAPRPRWTRWTAALCVAGATVAVAAAIVIAVLVDREPPSQQQTPSAPPKQAQADDTVYRAVAAAVIDTGNVVGARQR